MFWEQASDVHNELVCSLMSCDRFEEIMKYIHFNDNTHLDPEDKYSKVRPLMDHLNMKFVDTFCREEELDVDESMVPYYGRHGCKQFIWNKPIRFGYKIWCLNAPLDYLVKFIPYQRKGSVTDKELGLGSSVVVDFLSLLSEEDKYKVYFDNFFTSLKLVDKLTEKKIGTTGTVRGNRIEKYPITGVKEIKKKERGAYDYQYDDQKKLLVCRWNDNTVVTVVSNVHGVFPLQKAKRWSGVQKRHLEIDQPNAIKRYNSSMGGTDRMDQNIATYSIGIRSKNWWWSLFIWLLDVSIGNAHYLYKRSPAYNDEPLDLLGFKKKIVLVYGQRYKSRLAIGRPLGRVPCKRVRDEIRYDGKDHLVQYIDNQRRCGVCDKKVNFARNATLAYI